MIIGQLNKLRSPPTWQPTCVEHSANSSMARRRIDLTGINAPRSCVAAEVPKAEQVNVDPDESRFPVPTCPHTGLMGERACRQPIYLNAGTCPADEQVPQSWLFSKEN